MQNGNIWKVLALSILSFNANAYIMLGGWSHHLRSEGMNETHNIALLEHDRYIAGVFKNSYGKNSILAGYDFQWRNKHITYGIAATLVTGYEKNMEKITPIPMPYITLTESKIKPIIGMLGEAVFVSIMIDY